MVTPKRRHGIWERWVSHGRDPGSTNTPFSNVMKIKKKKKKFPDIPQKIESCMIMDTGYDYSSFVS